MLSKNRIIIKFKYKKIYLKKIYKKKIKSRKNGILLKIKYKKIFYKKKKINEFNLWHQSYNIISKILNTHLQHKI